jgi:hypothetical protein
MLNCHVQQLVTNIRIPSKTRFLQSTFSHGVICWLVVIIVVYIDKENIVKDHLYKASHNLTNRDQTEHKRSMKGSLKGLCWSWNTIYTYVYMAFQRYLSWHFCSFVWDKMWLFVLLILVELLTIISFHKFNRYLQKHVFYNQHFLMVSYVD